MSKGRYYPKSPKGQAGKGAGGAQDMLRQLQQVQKQMAEAQEELASATVEHAAGGGMVKVVADGQQNIKSITINPQVVDPDDVAMLEDMVLVAVNGALEAAQRLTDEKMGGLTGGLGLPPGLDLPGI
jgi:DNA-binding YbaB/EbfC family protein